MKPKAIAKKISLILEKIYPDPPVPLNHKDSYTLLVAVILSAHGRDATVNKVTPILFAKADTPEKMMRLSVNEIENIIRPCGLSPRKAKAIWEMSQILVEKYKGEVPRTFEDLESLPGVGHKTASVIMSQAFNYNAFPIDTHIHRSAKRWGLSNGKSIKQTEEDLKALFPEKEWNSIHLRIIYFGREYCPALRHNVEQCPVCSWLQPLLEMQNKI